MEKLYNDIKSRVEQVRENIEKSAVKAGRKPQEITLLGVTKTQEHEAVRALLKAGVTTIGENKVQELLEKEAFLTDIPHETHLIGHLQRNKAKFLPGHVNMLQSVDSLRLVEALEKAYRDEPVPLPVLVEVNIGDETSKSGISPAALLPLCERICASKQLELHGLMAIPPFVEGEKVRPYFAQMHKLFIDIKDKKIDNNTVHILSMGMSADYEYAIQEGATMVRVGTTLFGPRQY